MDDPRILRIITVGLILAALAVVYFLFTGGFSVKSKVSQTAKITQTPSPAPTSNPSSSPSVVGQLTQPTPTPPSAYNTIARRNQPVVQALPRTGFPAGIAMVFSISAIVSGLSLRKFHN